MVEAKITKGMYSYEEILSNSLSYFNGDELAATTWINKYAVKNSDGEFLEKSPDEMHRRMAKEFGRIELRFNQNKKAIEGYSTYGKKREALSEEKIYKLFKDFKYVLSCGSLLLNSR